MDIGAILGLVGFALAFGFAIWFGLREWRSVHRGIDEKIAREGWSSPAEGEGPLNERHWNWVRSMGARRDVTADRLAVNPGARLVEAQFTLVTRGFGGRAGARRHVGVGLVARLPHSVSPPMIAVPAAALGGFRSWFLGLDLPSVTIRDERLARSWSISSSDPAAAAAALERDAQLRAALMAVFEQAVFDETRFQTLILELNGDRAALLGGPKTMGSDPFSELERVAEALADQMR